MIKKLRFAVGGLVLACCLLAAAVGEETSLQEARVEKLIADLVTDQGIPGISVAIATHNQIVFANGFGEADVENSVPANSETRYRTASIAKTMTAATVLSLAEEGAIDLDAEVQRYCPDYPQKSWPVTARQLLGHLAGVRHYTKRGESTSTEHYYDLRSALDTFRDDPLLHQPGTKYHYSTFGFNLLGSLAEGATKKSFEQLLSQRVLRPAGMTHTVVDRQHAVISGRAAGYIRPTGAALRAYPAGHDLIAGQLYNSPLHDTSMKVPSGGLLSTASDLVQFATALNTGLLLSEETRKQMWTSQRTSSGESTGYGLGWRIGQRAGRKVVWHTGGQSGTSTVLLLIPETGTAVALMCNLQHAALTSTALGIADIVQPPPPEADYAEALKALERAIRYEIREKDLPAFSISLVDRERVVWARGFGFQDAERSTPATADTVYRVGSVSKLFTDIVVMQQVEQAKIQLDVPVQTYLPDFNPKSTDKVSITLRQLMSHQSGLVRESPVGNYFDPTEPSLAATVASLNRTTWVYPPNTKTKYSNAALAVVGAVLERSLRVPHEQHVRAAILDPLEMHDSSFDVTDNVRSKLATGWMQTYDGRRFQAPEFLLGTGPAGNMYSSVLDLSKFLVCMLNQGATANQQILQPDTFEQMTTPVRDAEGSAQSFGIGFHVQDLDGETMIGHGGAVYGFSTQLEALPTRKIGVAAVAALDGSNGVVRRLSQYALRLMLAAQDGEPLPKYRQTTHIAPERARDLVGLYQEVDSPRRARITQFGDQVHLQLGSYRYQLRASVDDSRLVADDALGFGIAVKPGTANRLDIGDAAFERLPDALPDDIPQRWQGLIGEYGWDHNTLYILEEGGQLYALIEWFYYYPLTEVDENTYKFPDYGLYHGEGLEFSRDASGRATQVLAAEVKFLRREVGTRDGDVFKITPVRPIDDLREEALAASPPAEVGDFRDADLVELVALDPTLKLDIRYASTDNFTGSVFYNQPQAFMQRPAAEAVVRVHQRLKQQGLGLLIHDAYRPWYVTKMFWDATPGDMKDFVANPANGSRHNRGCAVDLTLYDLVSGQPIQMVAGYDEFSARSFPLYPGGTSRQRWYRELLRAHMEAEGFSVYEYEWWHFDFRDWQKYRIQNLTFEQIAR